MHTERVCVSRTQEKLLSHVTNATPVCSDLQHAVTCARSLNSWRQFKTSLHQKTSFKCDSFRSDGNGMSIALASPPYGRGPRSTHRCNMEHNAVTYLMSR